jgi:hypothetical protein
MRGAPHREGASAMRRVKSAIVRYPVNRAPITNAQNPKRKSMKCNARTLPEISSFLWRARHSNFAAALTPRFGFWAEIILLYGKMSRSRRRQRQMRAGPCFARHRSVEESKETLPSPPNQVGGRLALLSAQVRLLRHRHPGQAVEAFTIPCLRSRISGRTAHGMTSPSANSVAVGSMSPWPARGAPADTRGRRRARRLRRRAR